MSATGSDPMAQVDADMRHVLDVLAAYEPKPISECTPLEARAQPNLMLALRQVLRNQPDEGGYFMEMRMIPGEAGDIRARVYTPANATGGGTLPMILYLHGGGFVIGDLDRDDETPRALVRRCNAIVVSAHYRQGPEYRFPAAHEDATTAWAWMLEHAEALGGDLGKIAIVGEDAGANLAVNIAIAARGETVRPKHLALIAPMADSDFSRPSFAETAAARPIEADAIAWFYHHALRDLAQLDDPRLALTELADLSGLPPTTIILAGSDPLRSEGEALADALRRNGVWVDSTTYDGVTAQFFGLARVVNKAMFAQGQVIRNLNDSFG
ncbi:MAG TPA: alpha/beta hydrolase [Devosia sp.]|nr:alpha/beta hydrolase [Devosia sp.]